MGDGFLTFEELPPPITEVKSGRTLVVPRGLQTNPISPGNGRVR